MRMSSISSFEAATNETNENFPVASWYLGAANRDVILKFYRFVRKADDIADSRTLADQKKIEIIDSMERELSGFGDSIPEAVLLRDALSQRGIPTIHAKDLLIAFRTDVTKARYESWAELMNYCSYSAMPVGRFLLDLHGEDKSLYPASDKLCAALQINNHLQDCRKDYVGLNRIYIPREFLDVHNATPSMLSERSSRPELIACLRDIAHRSGELIDECSALGCSLDDVRLGAEVSIVHACAKKICQKLSCKDPLCQRVRLNKIETVSIGVKTMFEFFLDKTGKRLSGRDGS